ncbi:MAG: PilN domain-containing protein [Phycisphaerales bacterium]
MKVDFLVDFLPPELRRRTFIRATKRRSMLLLVLLGMSATGVAAHSWNVYRLAEADRNVSLKVCTNSAKVDDIVDKLAADQQQITRFMGVYDQIALPLDASDLVATLTHLMPRNTSLAMVRLEVKNEQPAKDAKDGGHAASAAAKPAKVVKGGKGGKPAPQQAAPAKPTRWLEATIRGFAASNNDLYEFERTLSRTAPLEGVTVTENKPIEVPGSRLQEFTITCRIPLHVRYEQIASAATTAAPESAEAPAAKPAATKGATP